MALYRVKTLWTGFTGAPGYSIFHFDAAVAGNVDGAQNAADAIGAFNTAVRGYVPTGVTLAVEANVDLIEETTGDLVDSFSITPPASQTGSAAGTYSSAAGACVTWSTVGIKNGRRVRGRTFLVPLNAAVAFENNGTLSTGCLNALNTAAQALVDHASDFHIFSRPSAPGVADGSSHTVTAGRVADRTAVLRSRRD